MASKKKKGGRDRGGLFRPLKNVGEDVRLALQLKLNDFRVNEDEKGERNRATNYEQIY